MRRRGGFAASGAVLAAIASIAAVAPASASAPPGSTPDRTVTAPVVASGVPASTAGSLPRSGLRRELRSAIRSVGGQSGAWVFDTGAASKPLLFARNARNRRIPASNQKLFTTAAILDRFGPDHRFETRVYARGKRTGAQRQVLDGNLVIRGDGDPVLGTGSFAHRNGLPLTRIGILAVAVKEAGIRRVTGEVKADDSVFDRRRGIPSTGFRAGPYLSPLSGLSFNSGYRSGGGYAAAPELEAARALRRALRSQGVRVRGGVRRTALPRKVLDRAPVGSVASPPLSALAAATNKPSNNFFAEMLLKRLAAGPKRKGTTKAGARRVQRFAARVGTKVKASDGSGLGRGNRASPRQVGRLLRAVNRSDHRVAFRQSLAIAGRDGTLAGRMRGSAAEGSCRGKTGTLSGVSALSGYCTVDGDRIVFSILMNGVDATRARAAQDRMAIAIARYRR
ncbi:MAG TPA: D-alanyl-D-alanine carboxypeptidase/D-alanyl-D-alanine-endopeptidase [Solirubrobacterales bacterium]|nr:D-alanyl-D-alanine carboxypeptidase/D-alanyl-D-alanine-endopeptidase [Solirubrobacterales bacterium]